MPVQPVRKLDLPFQSTRSWRLPSMLYWERQKLNRIDDARADYPNCDAFMRRKRSIERRIARLEAEFRSLHERTAI